MLRQPGYWMRNAGQRRTSLPRRRLAIRAGVFAQNERAQAFKQRHLTVRPVDPVAAGQPAEVGRGAGHFLLAAGRAHAGKGGLELQRIVQRKRAHVRIDERSAFDVAEILCPDVGDLVRVGRPVWWVEGIGRKQPQTRMATPLRERMAGQAGCMG